MSVDVEITIENRPGITGIVTEISRNTIIVILEEVSESMTETVIMKKVEIEIGNGNGID